MNAGVREQGSVTVRKLELHQVALQQWRRDTEAHKRHYQAVQEKYEAYLQEKKLEREGRGRGAVLGSSATAMVPPKHGVVRPLA